ncbi:MAG TPA: cobalamin-dependent protein [Bacteroidales bacterium]|nr:cobalamin-dependent protein [Bacteroidales bacterium]
MENALKAATVIQKNSNSIAEKVVDRIYAANPGVWEKYGQEGYEMSVRDTESHIPYLVESVKTSDTSVFTDYVVWARQLFDNLKLPEDTMSSTLIEMDYVIGQHLDNESYSMVEPVFIAAKQAARQEIKKVESFIDSSNPLRDVLESYLQALLAADRHKARDVVFKALDDGVTVKDIYLNVFQPSQYEIGRLWQATEISVAKEHFASAATQQIMSQLYSRIFSIERIGKKMVAANVGGDLHEMGIRMVADFFEMEGWDTYFLGANTPLSSMLDSIKEFSPKLLALSASMPFHRTRMRDFVSQVKKEAPAVHIMIGGRAVKGGQEDLKWFGADSFARNAQEAVNSANSMI